MAPLKLDLGPDAWVLWVVAGLTHTQLTEIAYLLACCLHDGHEQDQLLAALESQLDITSGQARMLQHLAESSRMCTYGTAKQTCPALGDYTVCPILY